MSAPTASPLAAEVRRLRREDLPIRHIAARTGVPRSTVADITKDIETVLRTCRLCGEEFVADLHARGGRQLYCRDAHRNKWHNVYGRRAR